MVSIDTPQFTGDLLAVNNETYGSNVSDDGCAPAEPDDAAASTSTTSPTRPTR